MKFVLTILSILFSIQAWSQLDFKEVKETMPGETTDLKAVAIGDMNNDGRNDLVIGSGIYTYSEYDCNIFIFRQNSDGTMATPLRLRYPRVWSGLKVLQIADLNDDKLNDIVIGYTDSIAVYYQKETGTFGEINSYYSGSGVDGLKTGDLNNDGLTDIAVAQWNIGSVTIFSQKIGGGFSIKSVPVPDERYDEVDIADVNGDHLNDIILKPGGGLESTLQILYQDSMLGITDSVYIYKYPWDYFPTFDGIGSGDLNNDGRNDIVGVKGGNNGTLFIMYQDNLGKIENNIVKLPAYDIPTAVEIADLNCDGNNEIIVGHHGWEAVTIYEKDKTGQFSNFIKFHSVYNYTPYSMAIGDLNSDHKPDIVSVEPNSRYTIHYNISKPIDFSKIETAIVNLEVLKDTTNLTELTSEAILDPSQTCKVNRELQKQINTRYANEYHTGDSLTIRYANLCNSSYIDTITNHFSRTRTKIISVDTVKTIVSTDQLSMSTNWIGLGSAINSSYSFYLNSNICWDLSSDQDWLFPSKSSGSGGEIIMLAATANYSTSPRSAIITITGKDVPTLKIDVVQEAAMPFLSASSSSVTLSESVNNTAYFNILSNINWKIINPVEWAKIDKFEGSNNALIKISALPNNTNTDRSGIIFIQGDNNITTSLAITQLFTITDAITKQDAGEIKVHPNPFKDKVYVELNASPNEVTIDVFDSSGRKLMSRNPTEKKSEINMSSFAKGIYYMKITTNKNTVARKIIKE